MKAQWNLQVGWVNDGVDPVFLGVFRESDGAALYQVKKNINNNDDGSVG